MLIFSIVFQRNSLGNVSCLVCAEKEKKGNRFAHVVATGTCPGPKATVGGRDDVAPSGVGAFIKFSLKNG